MASEIRVDRITHTAGVGTITPSPTGVHIAGIVTGTTFSGSGASLTNVPDSALSAVTSSKLTGALPALDGSALTGVASTENIRTNTNATFLQNVNVSGSTTTGTAVVGGGVTISESGIEASGIGITCANINGTQIGGRRNIVINGSMNVAQRGTSSSDSGYATVDRFEYRFGGTDEAPVQTQADVASGTTPYSLGFRKSYKIQNGNQTSGAGASDNIYLRQRIEAQDIAGSGWNYTSSSSFITLSFWVKSSVAQNFYGYVRSVDGTAQNYPFETGSLSADTWTKVTKAIPGNSNLQFDNDNDNGLNLSVIAPFWGTDYTDSGVALNTWAAYASGTRTPDYTSTWYETNNATLEITGVQLEVGSQATAFEHRSFGEEKVLCQRYYYLHCSGDGKTIGTGSIYTDNYVFNDISFPVTMRANPSIDFVTGSNYYAHYSDGTADAFNQFVSLNNSNTNGCLIVSNNAGGVSNMSGGKAVHTITSNSASFLAFTAEL